MTNDMTTGKGKHTLLTLGVIAAVAAGVIAIALAARQEEQPAEKGHKGEETVPQVRVAAARTDTVRSVRVLPATVEPTRVARLASPAEGPVSRLLVRESDTVQSGRLLVVIGRDRTTRAELLSDREELRRFQDEYDRVERLVATGAIAGELLDKAKVDLERAKAKVEAGEELNSDFKVRAPWSGVVSKVFVQDGNYVAPRSVLLKVFDPASLVVRLALPEAIALKVRPGAEARVRFDALPDREIVGEVTRIYPEFDRKLRMRIAEVSVDDQEALAPGMFARVRLTVETVTEAVVVPDAAVVTKPSQEQAVFVVDEDLAHLRTIKPGIEEGSLVQVVSGVSEGDVVVVSGHHKLKDGSSVRIKAEPQKPQRRPETPPSQPAQSEAARP
jgi:membrane fusion protein, multidrug efflux system